MAIYVSVSFILNESLEKHMYDKVFVMPNKSQNHSQEGIN